VFIPCWLLWPSAKYQLVFLLLLLLLLLL